MRLLAAIVSFVVLGGTISLAQPQPGIGAAPPCSSPASSKLRVTLRPQKTEMWCWAASGQMVMEYLGRNVEQCEQANRQFNRQDCCQSPTPGACVRGGWPQFDQYGFDFQKTSSTALAWDKLQLQLSSDANGAGCKSTPFAFSWRWVDGGGHMMVAAGYTTDVDGKRFVFVNDPWEPNVGTTKTILYDIYDELSGDHLHWDDYYDVKKH